MRITGLLLLFALLLIGFSLPEQEDRFVNSVGMEMVKIDAGTFTMGYDGSRHYWTEGPAHEVTISKPFYISRTEVTLDQFREFRAGFEGTENHAPFVAGVSWHEATAFAAWLSEKEGKTYRLPTEAEWEYVARMESQPAERMLTGVKEWVHDWFGAYGAQPATDPVGPATGLVRVVRGGPLDIDERNFLEIDFARPVSRLGMPPSFGAPTADHSSEQLASSTSPGLIGVWYPTLDLTDPQESTVITRLDNNWSNDPRGDRQWAATWHGYLEVPSGKTISFRADTASPFRLEVDGKRVIEAWEGLSNLTGQVVTGARNRLPVSVSFSRQGGRNHFSLYWSWEGQPEVIVPAEILSHDVEQARIARATATTDVLPGKHAIGFRLVQGELPATVSTPQKTPLHQVGVKQNTSLAQIGPDGNIPYFRKRYYLPTPFENRPDEEIDALAMHPAFREHNHSPALEVMPNGDVLMVTYTSYREYEPGVSLIASRLRHGADEWDMPDIIVDLVGLNDHAPLLWADGDTVHLFWGSPKLGEGAFPFQWMSSTDNGASWGPIRFPRFVTDIGSHSRQPINSAFRDDAGRMYVASDGSGGESVLWASDDDGATWIDTGGRSGGRHTTFAPLSDGRILGLGGKNTHIDEFMPQSITSNQGTTYEISKTPFTRLGTNQRPTLIRLQSGRLFFAGDFIHLNTGSQPAGSNHTGSYVALSDDEGETWHIKKLIGAQPHSQRDKADRMRGGTLGYAVARQAPNGMIHLIGTMTNPNLHFELNEAWILSGPSPERPDAEIMTSKASQIDDVATFKSQHPNGALHVIWSGGTANDGRFLLHGTETSYYPDGSIEKQTSYQLGKKVGLQQYWTTEGLLLWSWNHHNDGSATWTQYHENGKKKSESLWKNFHADGTAWVWDQDGNLISSVDFDEGRN